MEMPRILYIDDEEPNLYGFKYTFMKEFEILTADNAQDGLKIIQDNEIHLAIADQRMPTMTGIEFFEIIAQSNPDTIRILLTAYTEMSVVVDAINRGNVYQFVYKPFDNEQMRNLINKAIITYNLKQDNNKLVNDLKVQNNKLFKALEKITHSEEEFRNLFNTVTDDVLILDEEGKIAEYNKPLEQRTHLKPEEIKGKHFLELIQMDNWEKTSRKFEEIKKNEKGKFETEFTESDGKKRYSEIVGKKISYHGRNSILFVSRDVTERKLIEQRILSAMVNAEEKERSRFAKELHDGLGPILSTANMYIQSIKTAKTENRKQLATEKLGNTIDEAIQSLQEISNNISPHVLTNFGLNAAIEIFFTKLKTLNALEFEFKSGITERIPDEIEISLYRITVELINNTVKYAHAKNVFIDMNEESDILNFRYQDDGIGFDVQRVIEGKKGMGLYNIKSRIKSFDGHLEFQSNPGKGFRTRISIKLPKDWRREKPIPIR